MRTLRVFISSPGDVVEERDKARRVVASLQQHYGGQVSLVPMLWEDLAIAATASFQEGIDFVLGERQRIDIAVFVLWSRLGSPLGNAITRRDGSAYRSGTERELDLMLEAFEQSGRKAPLILAYTRDDNDGFSERLESVTNDGSALEELLRQRRLVKEFIQERFHDEQGRNLRAYHTYREPVGFAQRLNVHLRAAVDDLLGLDYPGVIWTGAPYRSLEVFDIEHAPIFCGRDEETCELLQQLREQQAAGCAFVCIVGASGSGKSSLARAGLAATLTQRSFDDGVKEWRAGVFVPSLGTADLLLGLCRALAETLPELRGGVRGLETLAKYLEDGNRVAAGILVETAHRTASAKLGGPLRVLLVLDQMEELWTGRGITTESRERFLEAVEVFARSGQISVAATLRSDFYPQAQLSESFLRLKSGRGHFDLTPPGPAALQQLIAQPALRAGLSFERDPDSGITLDQRILEDASHDPSALPLLQYALTELYERRDEPNRRLTFAAYAAMGGVNGALGRRASSVLNSLRKDQQATFDAVLLSLVHFNEANGSYSRAVIPLESVANTAARKPLIEVFVQHRLFVTAIDQQDRPTIAIAHESLLTRWERAGTVIASNREFVRNHSRLRDDLQRWENEKRKNDYLLPKGERLTSARRMMRTHRSELSRNEVQFIRKSQRHTAFRSWKVRVVAMVMAVIFGGVILFAAAALATSYLGMPHAWFRRVLPHYVTGAFYQLAGRKQAAADSYLSGLRVSDTIEADGEVRWATDMIVFTPLDDLLQPWEWPDEPWMERSAASMVEFWSRNAKAFPSGRDGGAASLLSIYGCIAQSKAEHRKWKEAVVNYRKGFRSAASLATDYQLPYDLRAVYAAALWRTERRMEAAAEFQLLLRDFRLYRDEGYIRRQAYGAESMKALLELRAAVAKADLLAKTASETFRFIVRTDAEWGLRVWSRESETDWVEDRPEDHVPGARFTISGQATVNGESGIVLRQKTTTDGQSLTKDDFEVFLPNKTAKLRKMLFRQRNNTGWTDWERPVEIIEGPP